MRFVRTRVSVQNRSLTSIANALETWILASPLSKLQLPSPPTFRIVDHLHIEEHRRWKVYYPTHTKATAFFAAVEMNGMVSGNNGVFDGVFYSGEAVVVNDGPMFRVKQAETKKSVNSFVICLYEHADSTQYQVLARVMAIWKWHPTGKPDDCKYALYVKSKQTKLTLMHAPTSWHVYIADISMPRGSATGEFVSFSNIALVNPILVPVMNNIGGVRSVSHTKYYVIDPADAIAQWDE